MKMKITMASAKLTFGYMQKKLCLPPNFWVKRQEFP